LRTIPPIGPPAITGIHHVKVPVGDVLRSRDWYIEVLGFTPLLDFEDEDRLLGVAIQHPCGFTLGLHLDPERAAALRGFPTVALCAGTVDDLMDWAAYLDGRGIEHSQVLDGHLGSFLQLEDPDGLLVQLHTKSQPAADEA
jgi:catechol 2,3-dioxygenase-like lactoylglutathione lyase family enzyme